MSGNKPIKRFQVGQVKATIWQNKGKKDGKEYAFKSIGIVKSYKEGEDWKETDSFNVQDLPKLMLVAQKAYEYCALKNEEEKD